MQPVTPPEKTAQPFVFAATVSRNLIRGELITFYVDREGRITADKLEFIQSATLRLIRRPAQP